MSLRHILEVLRQRWRLFAVMTLIGVGLAGGVSFAADRVYTSTSSVYFSLPFGTSGTELLQGSNYAQNQMLSFAELAMKPVVLDPVIDELRLDTTAQTLARRLEAQASDTTVIIELSASDGSPQQAARIANTWAERLVQTAKDLSPKSAARQPTIEATIVAVAAPPAFASSPNTRRNLVAGLLAGAFVGLLLALLQERLDTRVRSASDVATVTSLPVLGEIAGTATGDAHRAMWDEPRSRRAEGYRRLRTNLNFLSLDQRPLVVLVTSALPGEGKSSTCINLAVALTEAKMSVLLIDADLRRPSIGAYLGLESAVGLTTVLIGDTSFDDALQSVGANGLRVMTSGDIPPNPSELLGSKAMERLIAEARRSFDVVLMDCAPLLPVTDGAVLGRIVSGALVVASCSKVHRHELESALDSLHSVDVRVLGVLLNRVEMRRAEDYYGYDALPEGREARHGFMTRGGRQPRSRSGQT